MLSHQTEYEGNSLELGLKIPPNFLKVMKTATFYSLNIETENCPQKVHKS